MADFDQCSARDQSNSAPSPGAATGPDPRTRFTGRKPKPQAPSNKCPPPEPPAESSEDNSSVEAAASSFLEGFHAEGVLETTEDDNADVTKDAVDLEASLQDAETSPVVALVDRILLQAMSVSASDIHVEPQQNGLRLRYRQDGVLQQ